MHNCQVPGNDLRPRTESEFVEDMLDVFPGSRFSENQLVRDLLIRSSLSNERRHLTFTRGQGVQCRHSRYEGFNCQCFVDRYL
jgi:hypothetical protein